MDRLSGFVRALENALSFLPDTPAISREGLHGRASLAPHQL